MPLKAVPLYLHYNYICPAALKAVEDEFHGKWLPQHSLDKELFHYTSSHGMQGILRERTLWLSDVTSFNDPDEIKYGARLVVDVLRQLEKQHDHQTSRDFLDGVRVYIEDFGRKTSHEFFVTCFCENGNLLSQWRGYADQARGYSLGFNFSATTRLSGDKEIFLRRVIYCKARQQNLVKGYIESACEAVRHCAPNHSELGSICLGAAQAIFDMMLCFKHEAFAQEKEWRLFRPTLKAHEPSGVRFRDSAGLLVAYRPMIVFDIADSGANTFPLRTIMCGPALEFDRARFGIEQLLRQLSTDSSPIRLVPTVEIKEPGYFLRCR